MVEGFLSLEGHVHGPDAARVGRDDALWALLNAGCLAHCFELRCRVESLQVMQTIAEHVAYPAFGSKQNVGHVNMANCSCKL